MSELILILCGGIARSVLTVFALWPVIVQWEAGVELAKAVIARKAANKRKGGAA